MLVDSHCHLDCLQKSGSDIAMLLAAARAVDVDYFLTICTRLDEFGTLLDIASNDEGVFASVGQHPSEEIASEPNADQIFELAKHSLVVGIGETGLDYHYEFVGQQLQRERFVTHITAAKMVKKPLIVHTRAAKNDTTSILKQENAGEIGGVLHCFTEDWQLAKQALDLGFYISFSGIVTFKNAAQLREVAIKVPKDRILVETDAPYLAPVPYRGQQNQPAYVRTIAEFIANLRGVSYQEFADQTTLNFFNLFVCGNN